MATPLPQPPPPRTAADYAAASALFRLHRTPINFAFCPSFSVTTIHPTPHHVSRTLPPLPTTLPQPPTVYAGPPVSRPLSPDLHLAAARTLYDMALSQRYHAGAPLASSKRKRISIADEGYATEDDDDEDTLAGGRNRGKVFREHTPEGRGWEEEVWLGVLEEEGDAEGDAEGEAEGEEEGDTEEEAEVEGEDQGTGQEVVEAEVEREVCLQQGELKGEKKKEGNGKGKEKRGVYPTPPSTASEQTVKGKEGKDVPVVTKSGRQSRAPRRWGG